MSGYKLLIDTNVFIGLEDPRLIEPRIAELQRSCSQHGIHLFVHEASIEDISRDKDPVRLQISLSKLNKFEHLRGIKLPPPTALTAMFGATRKRNDEVDVALLFALHLNAVDFLVTQDQGIHDRVRNSPLGRRVLTVNDALTWLRQTFFPTEVRLPLVVEKHAHEIDPSDAIFDSLRDGYSDFDQWWRTKCIAQHRLCWVVELGTELAAICV